MRIHTLRTETSSGWIMHQRWHDLLFAHWPVDVEGLRRAVPEPLELDLYAGQPWLGIVAFRLSGVKLRGLPEIPLVSHFTEINVRTYVRYGGQRGVYFLSLDADNPLAIAIARPWFRLNYRRARIVAVRRDAGGTRFVSSSSGHSSGAPGFSAAYIPTGPAFTPERGSLSRWLTERYSYFAVGRRGQVWRCDVWHAPWELRKAEAEIEANTLSASHGIELPDCEPLLHYAEQMDARIWPLRRV
jgi:uncharacterized protein YqjF (DUF2071 family)